MKIRGLIRSATIALLASAALAPLAVDAQAPPQKHAIVIGIDEYPTTDVSRLTYAVADARAMERILTKSGYQVTPLMGPLGRRETILTELQRLAMHANEQDSVLIYFAGHGVRRKLSRSNQSYWFTYGAAVGLLDVGGIRISHLIDYINEIPARRKILILDHCHSGEFSNLKSALGARDSSPTYRTLYSFDKDNFSNEVNVRQPDALVIFAAAIDKAFELPGLKHGLYTSLLINALEKGEADENKNGKVTVAELSEYMENKFADAAKANNVTQDSLFFVHGVDPNWVLVDVGAPSKELELLLGQLQSEGRLLPATAVLFYTAMEKAEEASKRGVAPDPNDAAYVDYLKSIRDVAAGSSARVKASMLENWVSGRPR